MNMSSPQVPCLVCQAALTLRLARGRKSGKSFLMLLCPQDGRHFRGFINDRAFVDGVLARLEGQTQAEQAGVALGANPGPSRPAKAIQKRGGRA